MASTPIRIQVKSEWLDTYQDTSFEVSWTGFRFQKEIRAGYTNDIQIPKTPHNLSVLETVGLLDSTHQLFGSKIEPCIMTVGYQMIPVYLQVAGVTANEIKICLYEDTFPDFFKGKTVNQYFTDDPSTIYVWNVNTVAAYPDAFKEYGYGIPYNANYAQYHPVKRLSDILSSISSQTGFNLPSVTPNWWLLASNKKVCPQNQKQYIEGMIDTATHTFNIHGGQHITNDLAIDPVDSGQTSITFNRAARITINVTCSWKAKSNSYQASFLATVFDIATSTPTVQQFAIRGDLYRNSIDQFSFTFNVPEGGMLSFSCPAADYYEHMRFIAECTVDNYVIEEDEEGEELQYINRAPRLVYYDWNSDSYNYAYWDATDFRYSKKTRGVATTTHPLIHTSFGSLSYFGYWANVPKISICDLFFSLQWMVGQKLDFDHKREVLFTDPNVSANISGWIEEIRPISDKLGQKNIVRFSGDYTPDPISTIANDWLQEEYVFHKSIFRYVKNTGQYTGRIEQYSNPEYDAEKDVYKVTFNDSDDPVLMWNKIEDIGGGVHVQHNYLRDIPLFTFGLEALTQSMEVTIHTLDPMLRTKDILWLDGRKYFVIDGKTSFETGETVITALLVPPQSQSRRATGRVTQRTNQ